MKQETVNAWAKSLIVAITAATSSFVAVQSEIQSAVDSSTAAIRSDIRGQLIAAIDSSEHRLYNRLATRLDTIAAAAGRVPQVVNGPTRYVQAAAQPAQRDTAAAAALELITLELRRLDRRLAAMQDQDRNRRSPRPRYQQSDTP